MTLKKPERFLVLSSTVFFAFAHLRQSSYAFFSPETLLFTAALLVAIWILFWTARLFRMEWMGPALLAVGLGDIAWGGYEKINHAAREIFGGSYLAGWLICALVLSACLVLFYVFRKIAVKATSLFFLFGAFGAVALSVLLPIPLFQSHETASDFSHVADKPNVYFFILDEHAGLESLKSHGKIDGELETLYLSRGFDLYEKAFTNYTATLDSVSSILNGKIYPNRQMVLRGNQLIRNEVFDLWDRQGYAVNVYENTHISFSSHPAVQKVFSYKENSAGYVRRIKLSAVEKFWVLLDTWASGTKSVPLKKLYVKFFRSGNDEFFMTGALAFDRVLEEVLRDASRHPSGRVFFVHLLIPHSSYVFFADGSVRSPFTWESHCRGTLKDEGETVNAPQDHSRKYERYIEQIRYLHARLAIFFDDLKSNHGFDESTAVLISDHGSRIYLTAPAAVNESRLTREDFLDAYNGFLAVKPPKSESENFGHGRIHKDPVSSVKVIGRIFGLQDFALNNDLNGVYLQGKNPKKTAINI